MRSSIHQVISVGFQYDIHFTQGVFDLDNPLLAQVLQNAEEQRTQKLLFVVDSNVVKHHPGLMDAIGRFCRKHRSAIGEMSVEPLEIPGGEVCKNEPNHLQSVYEAIERGGICRHSFVIAIGGGAVLDVAGYAAATAHRGVRHVRIPTTVLSQNDSGVGVKNGVNLLGKKNFLGAFAPPWAVINDETFLTTLNQRDWLAGVSEAIKVGLVKDGEFFRILRQNAGRLVARDIDAMRQLIRRCAELHANHISSSGDPFETGSSRPLDFGHWAAHKLEQMTNFTLRHGEAVAIGIALDTTYSALIGSLKMSDAEIVHDCIASVALPVYHQAMTDVSTLLQGVEDFREHLGGRLTITMLRRFGEGYEVHEIDRDIMKQAVGVLAESRLKAVF
jgi:3-dehydroquinate synthase